MLENQANIHSTSHHTEGLPPLWPLMETFGVTVNQCLEGTGLTMDQAKGYQAGMTPEQEFALYRNLLRLSGDAMLGLKLGELYHPQSYGMYGYAMLSARNVKMLVEICSKFHDLSFSHFKFRDALDEIGGTRLEFRYPLPQELIQGY
ncbi:Uncharacterised protein [Zhongshania aliphaticivorans]|uniref:HTH-type transcriptional regulator AraC-type N-terminal domain-containing protein n=1 Tax=Zhongshania aliphaticivorans TaxID=1470434 RepID=A0A5S9NSJ7_9GAMM|nr:AraC family transcriptional regulator ligand-binding domain-containing protein [Zhongshania aliphaticivorans]CAA0093557.1 Uncharacterised protein [Zhongshania aliphaticivorans]CAA0111523.1 Uncharacterised protein [Zhongshania aliphaticivorans]